MGQINIREVVLLNGSITTTGVGSDIVLPQGWQSATIMWNSTGATGTAPVLKVYVQRKLTPAQSGVDLPGLAPTGTPIYDDIVGTQFGAGAQTFLGNVTTAMWLNTANATTSAADLALSDRTAVVGTLRLGPTGGTWRAAWTVAGTTPVFTQVSVMLQLIPFAT